MDIKKVVLSIIFFWVIIISGFVLLNTYTLNTGQEVLLKTIPVDPRDLLRGDYVILNYEISQLKKNHSFQSNQTVFVVLKTDEQNIARVDYISTQYPKDKFFIKGKVKNRWRSVIEYGIESYFVKEGTGRELEQKLRQGAYAKVLIDKNGNAKVKGILY